jgi:hypothetical protein
MFAAAIWAVRIWRVGYAHRYPVLFAYLLFSGPFQFLSYLLYSQDLRLWGHRGYDLLWVVTTPIYWAMSFGLVFEVYGHMLEKYAGVRKLGRLVLFGALVAVASVAAAILYKDPNQIAYLHLWESFWLTQEQSVFLSIAGLVFVLLLFKKLFSLSISRNTQLVFTVFGLYFVGVAALSVVQNYVGSDFQSLKDILGLSALAVCLSIGAWSFSQAGELETVGIVPDSIRPETAAAAARHLESFNDHLVRVLNA